MDALISGLQLVTPNLPKDILRGSQDAEFLELKEHPEAADIRRQLAKEPGGQELKTCEV